MLEKLTHEDLRWLENARYSLSDEVRRHIEECADAWKAEVEALEYQLGQLAFAVDC